MILGRSEMIDHAKVEYVSKISKIQEADKKTKVDSEDVYKNADLGRNTASNEMILDNVKFGYNSDTNEFFVRITKGNKEYQYPTEDMFRLKQSLMEAYKENIKV